MKFGEIFRFEFRYQLRHISTWLLFAVFLLFGFMILRIVTLEDGTYLNSPGTIAFFTIFGSAIWLVTGGIVAGDAATRDRHTHIYPLTYTTPVNKFTYLGARFLAALAINAWIMLILYTGMLLSFYGPGAKTEFIGPFRLASYLTNYAFIALPTVIATTAIQFAFAALSCRAIASYIGSLFMIIFSHLIGTIVRFKLEWKVLGGLMDLLGITLVQEMESWTPVDKNMRLILLEGPWLWSRVLWFGIAAGTLAFTYFRFQLIHFTPNGRKFSFFKNKSQIHNFGQATSGLSSHDHEINTGKVPNTARDFAFKTYAHQALAIALTSFRTIAGSRGGLTIVAVLAIGTGLFATEYMEWLGVPLFARTGEVLRIVTPSLNSYQTQWVIIPLLTIFYAGELLRREREAGLNELSDTTPLPESVMFLGKFIGLALIIVTWVAFLMMAGIINQLVMGYHHFEIGVYIKALFGIQLTNYLLFALLVFAVHILIDQKYISFMVALGAYGLILFASNIGLEHHLLIYASDTGWSYSDMRGFGPFIKPWLWFKLYWASWAFLISVVAILFWVRSKEGGLKARVHLMRHRVAKHKVAVWLAVSLIILSGSFIFYNTNMLNRYVCSAEWIEMRAEYERCYGKYEFITQPDLVRTKCYVEIYPDKQWAHIQGTYYLVNRSKAAIDSIHLSTIRDLSIEISFDHTVTPTVLDNDLGYRIYSLKNPLLPGDSLQMNFSFYIKSKGFSNNGVDASVAGNGSHIDSNDWMPVIGYDEDRRLRKASDRSAYGLPLRLEKPSLYDVAARYNTCHAEKIGFETVVGTSKDQIAVAPGALRRTWMKGDRRYFHYVANAPILNGYAFFSAKYAIREAQWIPNSPISSDSVQGLESATKPVTIQIFYHPSHDANIDRMVKSAQASLDYYSQEFGSYPYSHFRVLERPGPGRGMHAEAMTIDYQEGYSLMNPKPDGLDLPYHIMAHEVAHQWWGISFAPAAVEGAGLLIESMATYSAMQVVEESLGYEHLLRYLSQMQQEYKVPRSRAAPPLIQSNNTFMNYRKGPFALFALRNYIGKERVNQALRQLLQNYTARPPLPTTLDLYRELQAVTPDSLQYLVHDLFATNTFWELETKQAVAKQTEKGIWQVRFEVETRKVTVESVGLETNLPMNDWIEIGVYGPRTAGESSGKVLYLQKHRIGSGKQTIILNVPEQPIRAGIDPSHLMIDLEGENNMRTVKIEN